MNFEKCSMASYQDIHLISCWAKKMPQLMGKKCRGKPYVSE
jgi:hypothetical protein